MERARIDFETLRLVAGSSKKVQQLYLRRQREAAREQALTLARWQGCDKHAQQRAGLPPQGSEPAARPRQQTQAQIARRARSQKQLRQKHLASKVWACVRVAARLKAWRVRSRRIGAPEPHGQAGRRPLAADPALFGAEGRFWSVCGAYRRVQQHRLVRKVLPAGFSAERPAVAAASAAPAIQTRMMSELIAERASRAQRPPTTTETTTEITTGTTTERHLQRQSRAERLAAAALENPDYMELQDSRGSKRDATARTPPPNSNLDDPISASQLRLPPTAVKKCRGGAACLSY